MTIRRKVISLSCGDAQFPSVGRRLGTWQAQNCTRRYKLATVPLIPRFASEGAAESLRTSESGYQTSMLYWLIEFSDKINVLNVFRYLTVRTGGAMITALIFVFLFGPWIIDHLRLRQGKGQPIRADGPQSHLATKRGTPTMGGLMILSGLLVATVLWANPANPYVWIVLGVTLGFGLVGFYDDYLKVTRQSHGGFAGQARLVIEFFIALIACYAFASLGRPPFATSLAFPVFKELIVDLGWFFVVFGAVIIVGAGNAVNLTDGLDGLAIGPVMTTALSFGFIAYFVGNSFYADYLLVHYVAGAGELAVLCGAVL